MPVFYFDVYDNELLTRDEWGVEIDDLREARDQAIAILPEMARDVLPDSETYVFMAEVRSEDGHICYRAKLTFEGTWIDLWEAGSSDVRRIADKLPL